MVKSKALLHEDKCLIMQPVLIKSLGKSAALLLQQIHFWINNKSTQGKFYKDKKWIANSYEGWVSDLNILSRSTINRSIKTLKNLGIISIEKLSDYKSNRTNWYTINYDRLDELTNVHSQNKRLIETNILETKDSIYSCSDESVLNLSKIQNEPMVIDKKTNKDILINPIESDKSPHHERYAKSPIAQQMVNIWNEIVAPDKTTTLTKERARLLIAALKFKFKNNLLEWKSYCLKLSTSDWLMGKIGKGFKIILESALKFSFIQNIFENSFGVRDISTPILAQDGIQELLENPSDSIELRNLKRRIYERVGHAPYVSWFKDCLMSVQEKTLEIRTKSAFCRDWINGHFIHELEQIHQHQILVSC